MSEFKTLQDFFDEPYDNGCCDDILSYLHEELTEEAIRWVDSLNTAHTHWSKKEYISCEARDLVIDWIEHFFNIPKVTTQSAGTNAKLDNTFTEQCKSCKKDCNWYSKEHKDCDKCTKRNIGKVSKACPDSTLIKINTKGKEQIGMSCYAIQIAKMLEKNKKRSDKK